MLARVAARIDLLAELKKLAAEYATARKDRSESDQKRMDQRAAERAAKEGRPWDRFLALDRSKPSADISELHFAWAGSPERWHHHYYRLAGPRFLVEYDNTQNDANHAHSVWRDPGNDFGDDLLRRHLAEDHLGTAAP